MGGRSPVKSSHVAVLQAELREALEQSGGTETQRVRDARNHLEVVEGIEAEKRRVTERQKRFGTWTPGIITAKRRVQLRIADLDGAREVWSAALDNPRSSMAEAGLRLCLAATAAPIDIAVLTNGFLKAPTTPGDWGLVDHRPWASWRDCLDMLMELTVPLHIHQLRCESFDSLSTLARECAVIIGERGDSLGFHAGKDADISAAANALSIGLAISAVTCSDGVTYRNMHWCTGCLRCEQMPRATAYLDDELTKEVAA
jgi:hypothetical protein